MSGPRYGLAPALGLAAVAGCFVALQSRYNGELGAALQDPYLAAFISATVGLAALFVMVFASPRATADFRGSLRMLRARSLPLWALSGGFAGAFLVLAQSAAVSTLGVSVFAVGTVAGQTVAGIALDRVGLGTDTRIPIRPMRALGAVLAIIAVVVAGFGVAQVAAISWLVILPLIAGMGIGWQAAVNGRLRMATGSALTATLLNFSVGWASLLVVSGVVLLFTGLPTSWPTDPLPYIGGLFGVVYVALSTYVVRATGVLVLGLAIITGQLVASVLLDLFLPLGPEPGVTVLLGIALSLTAVLVATWRTRASS